MELFIYNILIALLWALLTGKVSVGNLAIGFLLGYVALVLLHPGTGQKGSYFQKSMQLLRFSLLFTKELIVSSVRVAVAGPPALVARIRPAQIRAVVDVSGLEPRPAPYLVPVKIGLEDLPPSERARIALRAVGPTEIEVRIHDRRNSS